MTSPAGAASTGQGQRRPQRRRRAEPDAPAGRPPVLGLALDDALQRARPRDRGRDAPGSGSTATCSEATSTSTGDDASSPACSPSCHWRPSSHSGSATSARKPRSSEPSGRRASSRRYSAQLSIRGSTPAGWDAGSSIAANHGRHVAEVRRPARPARVRAAVPRARSPRGRRRPARRRGAGGTPIRIACGARDAGALNPKPAVVVCSASGTTSLQWSSSPTRGGAGDRARRAIGDQQVAVGHAAGVGVAGLRLLPRVARAGCSTADSGALPAVSTPSSWSASTGASAGRTAATTGQPVARRVRRRGRAPVGHQRPRSIRPSTGQRPSRRGELRDQPRELGGRQRPLGRRCGSVRSRSVSAAAAPATWSSISTSAPSIAAMPQRSAQVQRGGAAVSDPPTAAAIASRTWIASASSASSRARRSSATPCTGAFGSVTRCFGLAPARCRRRAPATWRGGGWRSPAEPGRTAASAPAAAWTSAASVPRGITAASRGSSTRSASVTETTAPPGPSASHVQAASGGRAGLVGDERRERGVGDERGARVETRPPGRRAWGRQNTAVVAAVRPTRGVCSTSSVGGAARPAAASIAAPARLAAPRHDVVHRLGDEQVPVGVDRAAQLVERAQGPGRQAEADGVGGEHGDAVADAPAGVLGEDRELAPEPVDLRRVADHPLDLRADDLGEVPAGAHAGADLVRGAHGARSRGPCPTAPLPDRRSRGRAAPSRCRPVPATGACSSPPAVGPGVPGAGRRPSRRGRVAAAMPRPRPRAAGGRSR